MESDNTLPNLEQDNNFNLSPRAQAALKMYESNPLAAHELILALAEGVDVAEAEMKAMIVGLTHANKQREYLIAKNGELRGKLVDLYETYAREVHRDGDVPADIIALIDSLRISPPDPTLEAMVNVVTTNDTPFLGLYLVKPKDTPPT